MTTAIIAAAGKGRRFGAEKNKVLVPLSGRPILYRTLSLLQRCPDVEALVVVTGDEDMEAVREIARPFPKFRTVCEGGAERHDSVWNALQACPPKTELVAVHDGARPFASVALVSACIHAARQHGAALPAIPVSDTLKRSPNGEFTVETVDRRGLYGVQTPQVFRYPLLVEACLTR